MPPISSIYCYVLHEGCVCRLLLSLTLTWEVKPRCVLSGCSPRVWCWMPKPAGLVTWAVWPSSEKTRTRLTLVPMAIMVFMRRCWRSEFCKNTHTCTHRACRSHHLVSHFPRVQQSQKQKQVHQRMTWVKDFRVVCKLNWSSLCARWYWRQLIQGKMANQQ